MRDFENPEDNFGKISAEIFAKIMGHVSDIALVIDGVDGLIRDVAYGTSDLANAGLGRLIGHRLVDVVTSESRTKVESLLAGSSAGGRWRHVNFPVQSGADVPISMQMFGLGGARLLAVGRDERQAAVIQRRFIEAQRDLEMNHARLRQADLRFQTMLALSELAVFTLDGESLAVIDVNAVATARLPQGDKVAAGQNFLSLFERSAVEEVRTVLLRAGAGRIVSFSARLRGGAVQRFQVALFRFEHASRLLVRMMEEEADREDVCEDTRVLFATLPHGLVITSADLRIVQANRAFIDLAQLSVEENAIGQALERFVGRNGVDTSILAAALREQGSVRNFATILAGAFGATSEIDIDAVRLPHADPACFGFFVRATDQARRTRPLDPRDRAGFAERMTEVVGRVSLKEIVRDTADVIERLCIETALGMTDNNRAAAAEMLGISRQSLYAKLARYGIDGDGEGSQSEEVIV